MSNPIFSRNVAELTLGAGIHQQRTALWQPSVTASILAMLIGGLSFLIPLGWRVAVWLQRAGAPRRCASAGRRPAGSETETGRARQETLAGRKGARRPAMARLGSQSRHPPAGWQLSPFRLLLYVAFSLLSLQATRNSHQFAAVVGTVTGVEFRRMGHGNPP